MSSIHCKPLLTFCSLLFLTSPLRANLIYQSALPGGYGQDSGSTVGNYGGGVSRIGVAFSLTQDTHVGAVGGMFFSVPFFGSNDIYGALLRLDSLTALPHGNPFDSSEVIATTVLHVTSQTSTDITAPLSVDLTAGSYALIFGSGMFGAHGLAAAPETGFPTGAQYLTWDDGYADGTVWHHWSANSPRFFVLSEFDGVAPVPDSSVSLAGLMTAGALIIWRRRTNPV